MHHLSNNYHTVVRIAIKSVYFSYMYILSKFALNSHCNNVLHNLPQPFHPLNHNIEALVYVHCNWAWACGHKLHLLTQLVISQKQSTPVFVTGFGKINHFVTFNNSNIYGQNTALYSKSQPYSEYSVSMYTELPENL